MTGRLDGVQNIFIDKYPSALFFRRASHILNLVNDLKDVRGLRNAAGTTNDIINFYREYITVK